MRGLKNTITIICALNAGCTAIVDFDDYRFNTDTHVDSDSSIVEADSGVGVDASVETEAGVDSSIGVDSSVGIDSSVGVDASTQNDASTYVEPNGPLQYQCQPCTNGTGCGTGRCSSLHDVPGLCHVACVRYPSDGYCTAGNSLQCDSTGCSVNINLVRNCTEWLVKQWGPKP